MKALKILGLVLLLASPLLSQPPGPPISPGSSGGSGTVTNTDATCADTQIIRADGASNTATQCSALTVADTTGNLTGPSGGFSIIGGTGASDTLTLDSTSNATNGAVQLPAGNSFRLYGLGSGTTDTEYIELTSVAGTGFTLLPVTNGTGGDNLTLTLSGEGPAGTLVLDGSDDVAGSVTVKAGGTLTTAAGDATTPALLIGSNWGQYAGGGNYVFTYASNRVTALNWDSVSQIYRSDGGVKWSTTTSPITDTWDAGLARSAAGVVKVTDGSTGIGKLLNARVVTPDIDGETTTAVQSGTVWTNTGDGDGEAITLLNDPTIGVNYCFAVDVAQTITVAPSTGETLYYGTDQCVVSLTSNAIGSTLCVTAITGGSGAKWFTMSDKGSWTCND